MALELVMNPIDVVYFIVRYKFYFAIKTCKGVDYSM